MKGSRGIIRAAALFLITATLLCAFTSMAAANSEEYDFSRPGSVGNVTLSSADILSDFLGLDISEAERGYLELYSDFSLKYAQGIPTSFVSADYDEVSGVLKLKADEYSYTAENGASVKWIPTKITYKNSEIQLENVEGRYEAELTGVSIGEDNSVKISYRSEFEISSDCLNSFLNLAYTDAPRLRLEIEEGRAAYIAASERYESDSAMYSEYLEKRSEYESLLAIYGEYLEIKKIYDENLGKYNKYSDELDDYERASALYAEYLVSLEKYNSDYEKYQTYISNKDFYDAQAKAYEKYLSDMARIKNHLAIIEALKTPVTSLQRTVYWAIMGDTVTQVVENKDLVAGNLTGADPAAVDLAGSATEKLRTLMADYFALTTENAKYTYYVTHYEDLKSGFTDLLRALDALYRVKPVWSAIKSSGKQEKFVILISQLYYVVNALSDKPVSNYEGSAFFDSGYYADPLLKEKPAEILGGVFIKDTNDATPVSGGYPQKLEKPEISPVPEPERPQFVKEPVKPDEVAHPGDAPEEISEPKAPEYMAEPIAPTPYEPPKFSEEIIELYDTGAISEREECTEPLMAALAIDVTKKFYGATEVAVIYHNEIGEVIYRTDVESGTLADFAAALPKKAEDASAIYTFSQWVDENGDPVDLSAVTEDLLLYPEFTPEYKKYEIKWNVNGAVSAEDVTWGELPEYGGIPKKEGTLSTYFVFSGWDKNVTPVSGSAEYTALFDEKYYVPFGNGATGAEISCNGSEYIVNCRSGLSNSFDISKLLELAGGNATLNIKTVVGDISFSYADTLAMAKGGVQAFKLSAVQNGSAGYIYTLSLYDENGDPVQDSVNSVLTLPCALKDLSHLKLYRLDGDERRTVRYSEDGEGRITFSALVGTPHYAMLEYPVTVIRSDVVGISVDKSAASPSDEIKLTFDIPNGVNFKRAYYIDENGEKVTIDGNTVTAKSYEMRIGVEAYYNTYTVKFISNGTVIAAHSYRYGEMPEVPADPKRVSDSKYDYTFRGWSRPIAEVTEDVTYIAKYAKTPIVKEADDGLQISPSIMRLLLVGGAACAILVLGFIPACVLISVIVIKRKKLAKPVKNVAREHT